MKKKSIKVADKYRTYIIFVRNIKCARGNGHKCILVCKNGLEYFCSISLAQLIAENPGFGFYLIHQSTMINKNYVSKKCKFNLKSVTINGGIILAVSARKQGYFKSLKIKKWGDLK